MDLADVPENLRSKFKVLSDTVQMLINEQALSREREVERQSESQRTIDQLQRSVRALYALQHTTFDTEFNNHGVNMTYYCNPTVEESVGILCIPYGLGLDDVGVDDVPDEWKQGVSDMPDMRLRRMTGSEFFKENEWWRSDAAESIKNQDYVYWCKDLVGSIVWLMVSVTDINQSLKQDISSFYDSLQLERADPFAHVVMFASEMFGDITPFYQHPQSTNAHEHRTWLQGTVSKFDQIPNVLRLLLNAVAADDECLNAPLTM